jgi:hypothetical protein
VLEKLDINAPSRKYQDAQHSSVGRVNLGARIAPNASRKCQENYFRRPRIYRGRVSLPRQAKEALITGAEMRLGSKMKHR